MYRLVQRRAAITIVVLALTCLQAGCSTVGSSAPARLRLTMLPQLAQAGPAPAAADAAQTSLTAKVDPVQRGRKVVLERRSGRQWKEVGTARTDGRGVAEFNVATGSSATTYRARAPWEPDRPSVVSAPARTDRWPAPVFDDEFSGRALGKAWASRLSGYVAASQRTCSKADDRSVSVGGGVVRLSVLKDPDHTGRCTYDGKQYDWRLNGHIGTENSRSFRYGIAAARLKFQPGRGQHGAFWMQPASRTAEEGDPKNTGAEIDVIEGFGDHHPYGGLTSFVYSFPDNGEEGVTGVKHGGFLKHTKRYGKDWSSVYHVFSVEWTPQRYVFRIDGRETFRTSKGVSGRPEYLVLSLLSSDYELPLLQGRLPQSMSVDWVRFWQR